eukprot:361294-Chlamydomonas_euryale.AAC.1
MSRGLTLSGHPARAVRMPTAREIIAADARPSAKVARVVIRTRNGGFAGRAVSRKALAVLGNHRRTCGIMPMHEMQPSMRACSLGRPGIRGPIIGPICPAASVVGKGTFSGAWAGLGCMQGSLTAACQPEQRHTQCSTQTSTAFPAN